MDTSESLKSETTQSTTNKEQSPQKEQSDNNASGMCQYFILFFIELFFSHSINVNSILNGFFSPFCLFVAKNTFL